MGYMIVEHQQIWDFASGRVRVKVGHGERDLSIEIDPNHDTGYNECGQIEGATDDYNASIANNGAVYVNQKSLSNEQIAAIGADPQRMLAISALLRQGAPLGEDDMQKLADFAQRAKLAAYGEDTD